MKQNSVMFENVRVEMARKDLTILDIANLIGMSRETLSRKLSGKAPLRLEEAFAIQRIFPDVRIEVLFKECSTA